MGVGAAARAIAAVLIIAGMFTTISSTIEITKGSCGKYYTNMQVGTENAGNRGMSEILNLLFF